MTDAKCKLTLSEAWQAIRHCLADILAENAEGSLCSSCQKCLMQVCKPHDADGISYMSRYKYPDMARSYNFPLHDNYQSWVDAVRAGCWICSQLQEYIPAPILGGWATTRTIPDSIMYSATVFNRKPFSLSITAGVY